LLTHYYLFLGEIPPTQPALVVLFVYFAAIAFGYVIAALLICAVVDGVVDEEL